MHRAALLLPLALAASGCAAFSDDTGASDGTSVVAAFYPLQYAVERVAGGLVEVDSLAQQLRGLPRFFQDGWGQASRWALQNTKDLDHAEAWADSALKFPLPTFQTLQLKAAILDKRGNKLAADSVRKQAMLVANENDVNLLGYGLLNQKKYDEAIARLQKRRGS